MKKLAVFLALLMILAVFPVSASAAEKDYDYKQTLFDRSSPIVIDIRMDDATWDNMIATAEDEVYSSCTLVVNGVTYENVAIRPKGNSSMMTVTSSGSERYSWRIKFDKYEKGRTCDGLDILILNNGTHDPGNLQEAISYDMYAFLDADASLINYAVVYHNGEYFGVYLALEGVDESFVESRYGEKGELYKPEMGGGNWGGNRENREDREDGDDEGWGASFGGRSDRASGEASGETEETASAETRPEAQTEEATAEPAEPAQEEEAASEEPAQEEEPAEAASGESEQDAQNEEASSETSSRRSRRASGEMGDGEASGEMNFGGGWGGGNGGGWGGADASALNYVGDDLSSYQSIWDSAKFKSDETDYARVVEALKHVCAGEDIADYLEVDNVLKYFAIQTFIYNRDGLSGNVAHNYYLYEQDGKLNLFPWDLNESFSVSGNGSAYVNFPIDTPFTVSDLSQRSFFMALLANEEYLAQYHEYLRQLSEEYVQGGALASLLESIFTQVEEYYKTDPTAFSDYETIAARAEGLQTVIELRAESVLGQIAGEIPSTRDGQNAEPDKLLDTSGADLSGLTGGSSGEMRW